MVNDPAPADRVILLPALISKVLDADPLKVYRLVPSVVPEFNFKVNELATLDAFTAVPPADNAPTSLAVYVGLDADLA